MSKQDLFNYMAQDHNTLLLESEIYEIERIVTGYRLPDEAESDISKIKQQLITAFHEMSLTGIEFNYQSVCDVVNSLINENNNP